jgi:hypothetical protein
MLPLLLFICVDSNPLLPSVLSVLVAYAVPSSCDQSQRFWIYHHSIFSTNYRTRSFTVNHIYDPKSQREGQNGSFYKETGGENKIQNIEIRHWFVSCSFMTRIVFVESAGSHSWRGKSGTHHVFRTTCGIVLSMCERVCLSLSE